VDERSEQEQGDRRLLDVEALREVRDRGSNDDTERELPRAPSPLGERARQPDQAEPACDGQDAGGFRPARREDSLDDLDSIGHLRRQRRDEPDHADEGGSPGQ
jgi:hypothetical protein